MSTTANTTPLGQLTLKNVRLAYCHLDKPWAKKGDDQSKAKYGVTPIIEKNDPQLKGLKDTLREVATAKWGDAYSATKESGKKTVFPKFCLRDAAADDEAKQGSKDGFTHGPHFFNASRRPENGAPVVRNLKNRDLDPIKNAAEWPYSGCYGHVVVKFWAQDNKDGQRVNAEIVAVVKCGEGEKFGGDGAVNVDEALAGLVETEDLPGITSTTYAKPADAALGMGDL